MADGTNDNVGDALLSNKDSVTVQIVPPKAEDAKNGDVTISTPAVNMDEEAEADLAIRLTGAYKSYGRGGGKTPVLLGLDMAVPRGKGPYLNDDYKMFVFFDLIFPCH